MMIGYGNKILEHKMSFWAYIRKRLNRIDPREKNNEKVEMGY